MGLATLFQNALSAASRRFSSSQSQMPIVTEPDYDAAEGTRKRKSPRVTTAPEDTILNPAKRARMTANARNAQRNIAIAAWAIRRHLDYVTNFQFHARTEDNAVNDQIEQLFQKWSRPWNCDISGRHRFSRFLRIAEARRVLDGDVGIMRLASGQLQMIEGDRIQNPTGQAFGTWFHGVKVNDAGRALAYALHKRMPYGGLAYERTVGAQNVFLLGYYDRYDQVRGISPITTGLNHYRDTHENFDYALARAKISQLFALAFFRDADKAPEDEVINSVDDDDEESETEDEDAVADTIASGFDSMRPMFLDMQPGEKAEFMESSQPSDQWQNFMQLAISCALKALDIPFSFFDEAHTNFFGSRGALMHYERCCESKRDDLKELLDWITLWRLQLAVVNDELKLPGKMQFGDIEWEWIPRGIPWWDPSKEITGDLKAISAGLDNPIAICKRRGDGDVFDNIDATAKVIKYAREHKDGPVPLSFDAGPVITSPAEDAAAHENPKGKK